MLLLNKNDIKKIFSIKDAIKVDKLAFSIFSKGGSVSPLRTNMNSENEMGNVLYMPGYVKEIDTFGLKIVSVFPNNSSKNLPSTLGTVLLVNDRTGMVDCILDGTYITELRTGAATGAAISLLAKKNSKVAALIGTGGQAESQLEAIICSAPELKEIKIHSRNSVKREDFAKNMSEKYGDKVLIKSVLSSEEAVDNSDIVVLVTNSKMPVINGSFIKKGALVSGIGSYMPSMREIDEETLLKADKIYFDSREAVLSEAGCIITPLKNEVITDKKFIGELGQLINGDIIGRESDDEVIIFKSVGISTQDIVTSKMIFDKAKHNNIGMCWE